MTCQVQITPYSRNRETGARAIAFANVDAARKYLDRAGRMDARPARAAVVKVQTAKAHGAKVVANFPRADGKFRAR